MQRNNTLHKSWKLICLLLRGKSIWSKQTWLCSETLPGCQVCMHLRTGFGPLLSKLSKFEVSTRSRLSIWKRVWRLAEPIYDQVRFVLSRSFIAIAVCFGSPSFWMTHFMVHRPVHWPLNTVKLSCTLSRKTVPKHNAVLDVMVP